MKEMEGIASIALLPCGSISGHFIHLPHSTCYGLHGTELACERECSRGDDYRLIKLNIVDFSTKREATVVVECKGHDAARFNNAEHVHGWGDDVTKEVEQKQAKNKITVSFECQSLKADKAAEDHIKQFMPKLMGMDAVVHICQLDLPWSSFADSPFPSDQPSVKVKIYTSADSLLVTNCFELQRTVPVNVGKMTIKGLDFSEEDDETDDGLDI